MNKFYNSVLLVFVFLFLASNTAISQSHTMPQSGSSSVVTCGGTILDPGGTSNYPNSCTSTLVVYPTVQGCSVTLYGSYNLENNYDYLRVYSGVGASGTLLGSFTGSSGTVNVTSQGAPITLVFTSDGSVTRSGFELAVSCSGGCACGNEISVQPMSGGGVHVSWDAVSSIASNTYLLEYGLEGFAPGTGTSLFVTGTSVNIPDITEVTDFCVYYDCNNDNDYTNDPAACITYTPIYLVPASGSDTITSCSGIISDAGGLNGNYTNNNNGILVLRSSAPGCQVEISGSYNTQSCCDSLYVYDGIGTGGTLLRVCRGSGNATIRSQSGALTLRFKSDNSSVYAGFEFALSCVGGCACGAAPENVAVQEQNGILHVTWSPTLVPGANHYIVEYGSTGFMPGTGTQVVVQGTSYDIVDPVLGQQYEIRVYYDCGNDSLLTYETPSSTEICLPDTASCIDFSTLSSPNILCQYGTFSNPYSHTGIVDNGPNVQSSRHTIIVNQGTDPRTNNQLNLLPPCENYSVRLGNWATGAQAESITYNFYVDTTEGSILLLKYAAVLQDPNHTATEQPRFKFELLNSNNQLVDPVCGAADYIANPALGWNIGTSSSVIWKDWTNVGTDLSAYHGQNIRIRLTTYDCEQSGHYGYAYFHLNCKKKNISVESCGNTDYNTYSAPSGFSYEWYYQSNPNHIISTGQSVTIPQGNDNLFCKVSSLNNPDCFFTLWTSVTPRYPVADFAATNVPCSYQYTFDNQSVVSSSDTMVVPTGETCDGAYWDFGDGYVSNELAPTHEFPGPGTYPVTLVAKINHGKCTDTLTTLLTVAEYIIDGTHYDTTVCDSYTWGGQTYVQTGTYVKHFTGANGCDSTVTLHLTVNNSATHTFSATACDTFVWAGQTYTQSGSYTRHFQTVHGCDSAVTLNLTIHNSAIHNFNATACDSYTWNGQTYTQSGDYTRHFQTIHGCDSTVTLHLTIHNSATSEFNESVCVNYQWNQQTYNQTGDYTQHFQTVHGCDSTVTLHLTIRDAIENEFSDAGCEHYTWNGETYDITGDYQQTFVNAEGCDSIVTLHLTIHPSYDVHLEDVICEGMHYIKDGFNVTPQQTLNRDELTLERHLHSQYGCDSLVTLNLTIVDTTLRIIATPPTLCENFAIELQAESKFNHYEWSTGEISNIIVVVDPGLYTVTATGDLCSSTAGVTIEPCGVDMTLPNAISPSNQDGMNDYFYIDEYYQRQMHDFFIRIYDRWGDIVFSSTDKNFRWYGDVNGKTPNNVVYSYIIQYRDNFGERFLRKGTLVVL